VRCDLALLGGKNTGALVDVDVSDDIPGDEDSGGGAANRTNGSISGSRQVAGKSVIGSC
jgi:hypothetical protein